MTYYSHITFTLCHNNSFCLCYRYTRCSWPDTSSKSSPPSSRVTGDCRTRRDDPPGGSDKIAWTGVILKRSRAKCLHVIAKTPWKCCPPRNLEPGNSRDKKWFILEQWHRHHTSEGQIIFSFRQNSCIGGKFYCKCQPSS